MRAGRDGLVRTAIAVGGAPPDLLRLLADDPAPGVREQARRALGIHPGPEGKSSTAPLGACGESR